MDGRLSNRAVGRVAAVLFIASGMVTVTTPLLPAPADVNELAIFGLCLAAVMTGLIIWVLPWHRWNRTATLWMVPLTYVFIAVFNALSGADTYRYSLFFMVN